MSLSPSSAARRLAACNRRTPVAPPPWAAEVRAAIEFFLFFKSLDYKRTHPKFQTPSVEDFYSAAACAARGEALPTHLQPFFLHLCTKHYSKCPMQQIGVTLVHALALQRMTAALLNGDDTDDAGGIQAIRAIVHSVDWFLANIVPTLHRRRERFLHICKAAARTLWKSVATTVPPDAKMISIDALDHVDATFQKLLEKGDLPLR